MSATLRYDVGILGGRAILDVESYMPSGTGMPFFHSFGMQRASRYAGVGRPRKPCYTFAVKLPKQVGEAYAALLILQNAHEGASSLVAVNSLYTLFRKLLKSLGLPDALPRRLNGYGFESHWGRTVTAAEFAFLGAIHEAPGELGRWLVYADWLEEQGDPGASRRGRTVRAWSGGRACKVTYGVPNVARDEPRGGE